jgi:hypothetical protein
VCWWIAKCAIRAHEQIPPSFALAGIFDVSVTQRALVGVESNVEYLITASASAFRSSGLHSLFECSKRLEYRDIVLACANAIPASVRDTWV